MQVMLIAHVFHLSNSAWTLLSDSPSSWWQLCSTLKELHLHACGFLFLLDELVDVRVRLPNHLLELRVPAFYVIVCARSSNTKVVPLVEEELPIDPDLVKIVDDERNFRGFLLHTKPGSTDEFWRTESSLDGLAGSGYSF